GVLQARRAQDEGRAFGRADARSGRGREGVRRARAAGAQRRGPARGDAGLPGESRADAARRAPPPRRDHAALSSHPLRTRRIGAPPADGGRRALLADAAVAGGRLLDELVHPARDLRIAARLVEDVLVAVDRDALVAHRLHHLVGRLLLDRLLL